MEELSGQAGVSPQKATLLFAVFAAGVMLCIGGLLFTFGLLDFDQLYNAFVFAIAVIVILMPVFYFVAYWQARLFATEREHILAKEARMREFASIATDWLWKTDAELNLTPIPDFLRDKECEDMPGTTDICLDNIQAGLLEGDEKNSEYLEKIKNRQAFKGLKYVCDNDEGRRRVFSLSGKPEFDEVGQFKGYQGIGTDITLQMSADYLVRHESANLFQLLDRFAQGVMYLREGRVLYANLSASKILGYDRQELLGLDLQSISVTRLPAVEEMAPALLEQTDQPAVPIELQMRSKEGADIYLQAVCQRNDWETPVGMTLTFFDATSRRLDDDNLRRQHRFQTVGRLSSGVAHDFNNFLAIILGNLELIEETLDKGDVSDLEKFKKRIAKSLEATERGTRLVEQLVSYAQKQHLEPVNVELDSLLQNMALLLKSVLGSGISFDLELAAAGQTILVDPGRLEDALINLLLVLGEGRRQIDRLLLETKSVSIATEDMPQNAGKIRAGEYVVLCVDQGDRGVDGEFLAKAEDPFMTDSDAPDQALLAVSALIGFISQSGGFYEYEKRAGGENVIRLYFPRQRKKPDIK